MREIAWIEREGVDQFEFEIEFGSTHNYRAGGGGPVRVRVRDRVRIDTQLSSRGGVDRFEFEFEFGSTHNYRAGGGWTGGPVRVDRFSSSDRRTIIEPGGGGPVRVRVRIDTQLSSRGGVDRFEFEFEFGSTHNYRAGGVDRFEFEFEFEFGSTTQLSSRGGWTGSSSSSGSDRRLRDL